MNSTSPSSIPSHFDHPDPELMTIDELKSLTSAELDLVAASGLADIPWPLITRAQVREILAGREVRPTAAQSIGRLRALRPDARHSRR